MGNKTVHLPFDPSLFRVQTESVPLDDSRLSRVWGKQVHRITLQATKASRKGRYQFSIQEVKP